jgi:LPS sulfotransferase NodH
LRSVVGWHFCSELNNEANFIQKMPFGDTPININLIYGLYYLIMLEINIKQALNPTKAYAQSDELDNAMIYCIYSEENDYLLEKFIEYHLNLGFKKIEILNYSNNNINLNDIWERQVTIENISENISPQKLINKKKQKSKKRFYSLLLKINQFFHYQYSDYISIESFFKYLIEKNYQTIPSYILPITGHEEFLQNKFKDLKINIALIKESICLTKENYNNNLKYCTKEALTVIFELQNSQEPTKHYCLRNFSNKNEIIEVYVKNNNLNQKYKMLFENKILDEVKLKDYLTKYIEPQEKKNFHYQKFLIYCLPRTGSNLLCSLLNNKTSIECHAEVFSPRRIYSNLLNATKDIILKIFRTYNPAYLIKLAIWHNEYQQSIKAVGFKVLYNQLKPFPYLDEYLFGLKNLKIIFLKRKNYLARIYSNLLAEQNDQWILTDEQYRKEAIIKIPYEKYKSLFEEEEEFYVSHLKLFDSKNISYLEIDYEDLNHDPQEAVDRITKFLGVDKIERRKTYLKKQNIKKLNEVIENYQELKKKFQNTKWEIFFEY